MNTRRNWRTKPFVWLLASGLLALLLNFGTLYAAGETLVRSAIVAGGGSTQASGISVRSSVGQPVAGVRSTGSTTLCSGVACPGAALPPDNPGGPTIRSWLPIIGGASDSAP